MSTRFDGKTALVTGAASGIGRETALAFAARGASVELVDVDTEGLDRTALLCRELGVPAEAHAVDVSSAEAMRSLAERVHQKVPAVDVLVNNAGVAVIGSFVGTDLALWHWAIGINVMGVVHGCHFFVPKMIERGSGGHVVNVSSVSGLAAPKLQAVYAATKFAVVGLSDVLRAELRAHGISVATICPGIINTPITRNARLSGNLAQQTDFHDRIEAFYRKRNYGPERVATAILDAVEKRRGLTPVSPEAWAIYYGKRFLPRLMDTLLGRDPPM